MKKSKMPKERQTTFKELSFFEKIEYIWGYYKYHMLAVVIAAVAIAGIVFSYIDNNYDTVFSLVVVDGKMSGYDDNTDTLTREFTEYLGIDGTSTRVDIDYNYSLIAKPLDNDAQISQQKIYVLASTGSMDGYLASKDYITYFSTNKEVFLEDLTTILTSEELEKIGEDNIIYYTIEDGTKIPVAVNLSNTRIKTGTNFTMENPCYGVVVTAANKENAIKFIRYAFDL